MKGKILIVWLLFLALTAVLYAMQPKANPVEKQSDPKKAQIDLAFCLDTTGSMSGLLEGAKQKIWSIVNTVAAAQPMPELRIGLVAYRDIGDEYVTRVFPFTSDLETMYSQLRQLQAGGGGDTPESVNRALEEAVSNLQWGKNSSALKIVYLVGDAPPHMDYHDQYDYRTAARRAAGTGIIINTIQCGSLPGTQPVWQEIAKIAEGKYASIDQNGGIVAVASPYDRELARLSAALNQTYVAYGKAGAEMKQKQALNDTEVSARGDAPAAERAASKSSELYRNESWDLVDALKNKTVKLEALPAAEVPVELRNQPVEEQKKYLEQKSAEREKIQRQIQDLSGKRDAYVATRVKKDGFDSQVITTLKEQAKDKGIEINR